MPDSPDIAAVQDAFTKAVEAPPENRAAVLAAACGADAALRAAVESLLAAHDRAGAFLSSPEIHPDQLTGDHVAPGTSVGPYRLIRSIGEGGLGTVYLAETTPPADPPKQVAIKVIKAGMDTRQVIARFDLERRALALMDHPFIARVLDAGATDAGRPYFVMEFVDGFRITDYAREKRLTLPQRLTLFADVCAAIAHAHQKGIIHRDLKPANVLVAEVGDEHRPIPKIIDFGIAKALFRNEESDLQQTMTLGPQILGTPQYMSPEQARPNNADIDSRTDIYSLGVLLYELITGSPPFDPRELRALSFVEVQRLLREIDPVSPSVRLRKLADTLLTGSPAHATEMRALSRTVAGEIDWIVMRAMEKDRARRYDTVETLRADILAAIAGRPILAAPDGILHRLRRRFRRHRRAITRCAAALLFLLLGSIGAAALLKIGPFRPPLIMPATAAASQPLAPGLEALIFQGSNFETLVDARIDDHIDFLWTHGALPAPGIVLPHYSIIWSGLLVVPSPGVTDLYLTCDDGARLIIDNVTLLSFARPGQHGVHAFLEPGPHHIRVEYWNRLLGGDATLRWKITNQPLPAIIPPSAFFHTLLASQPATE